MMVLCVGGWGGGALWVCAAAVGRGGGKISVFLFCFVFFFCGMSLNVI